MKSYKALQLVYYCDMSFAQKLGRSCYGVILKKQSSNFYNFGYFTVCIPHDPHGSLLPSGRYDFLERHIGLFISLQHDSPAVESPQEIGYMLKCFFKLKKYVRPKPAIEWVPSFVSNYLGEINVPLMNEWGF